MAQLTARRGDDEHYLMTVKKRDGSVRDLTDCTVFFTVKETLPAAPDADLDDATAFLKYHWKHDGTSVISSEGMRIPEGATEGDGQLEVLFPRSLTTTWPAMNIKYEVQITVPEPTAEGGYADDTPDSGDFVVALDRNRRRTP
jgi:hypothetical protein